MGLTSGEVLDVVYIAYYIPALLVSLYLVRRHGFRRSNGWLYILILDIVRIVGSVLGILATQKKNRTMGQIAAVLSSVGLSVLIHTLVGLLRRINESVHKDHRTPPKWIDLTGIPLIIGIGLAAWGGYKMGDGKPEDFSSGQSKFKIGAIIFFIVILLVTGFIALAFTKKRYLPSGEFRVVLAMGLVVPFLFVRVIYVLALAFASESSKIFSLTTPDITVEAVMSTAPEFISVAVLLTAGVLAKPSSQVPTVGPAPQYEMLPDNGHGRGKYQQYQPYETYPGPAQQSAWQPTAPNHTHNAHHYYQEP